MAFFLGGNTLKEKEGMPFFPPPFLTWGLFFFDRTARGRGKQISFFKRGFLYFFAMPGEGGVFFSENQKKEPPPSPNPQPRAPPQKKLFAQRKKF